MHHHNLGELTFCFLLILHYLGYLGTSVCKFRPVDTELLCDCILMFPRVQPQMCLKCCKYKFCLEMPIMFVLYRYFQVSSVISMSFDSALPAAWGRTHYLPTVNMAHFFKTSLSFLVQVDVRRVTADELKLVFFILLPRLLYSWSSTLAKVRKLLSATSLWC